jgi:hypothetical protein
MKRPTVAPVGVPTHVDDGHRTETEPMGREHHVGAEVIELPTDGRRRPRVPAPPDPTSAA